MKQSPSPADFLLRWRGDALTVTLTLDAPRKGRAALRTNLGHAAVRRREIVEETELGLTPLARAWTDLPLVETSPGTFTGTFALDEVGVFSGKACFFPEGSSVPEWPDGQNFHIKVESAETRRANSIYCVFPRQFGSFREVIRRLPLIMDAMGFRIIQTLPPFPVPTSYAVMGEYGCPFAATDFHSVDPALAEFDESVTPLGQFKELIGSVHAKRGLFFVDLPANHTGWASTLQTHHPEWFVREGDGRFHSPGAWGVTWGDLVELDYGNAGLRRYMADVFLFWCRIGVDGFRCDAGYMIPAETWEYIVAKVREEYPDTIFLLEGLGGKLEVTDRLLAVSNLDWAYSEIFQTYDRGAFEWYLPQAFGRSERFGTLVHFAETHDNDRLAKNGQTWARLRVQLAALLSWQGAWGIANGVEWYATEKIDVHGKNDLNWGASDNMVSLIARLNEILRTDPSFEGACHLSVVTRGDGNTLAVLRKTERRISDSRLLLANLDCSRSATIDWDRTVVPSVAALDALSGRLVNLNSPVTLGPGEVMFLRDAGSADELPAPASVVAPPPESLFHAQFPRDVSRDLVVPEGQPVSVSSDAPFRLRLIDPATGCTLHVERIWPEPGKSAEITFTAPAYVGDGTRCRSLDLDVTRYVDGRALRTHSHFLVPPSTSLACAALSIDGDRVRHDPDTRAVLSNGAGASAQVRAGFGRIASQYDAYLAANPNPAVPSDRIVLWTRTRGWLQREGYVRELDAKVVTEFAADSSGRYVTWKMTVPCGMGRETAFRLTLALAPLRNDATFTVARVASGDNDVDDSVRLVLRPDLEWRSFHATTKAYAGAEGLFPCRATPREGGFDFAPYDGVLSMRVKGGEFHYGPEWSYSVGHPEEAARGQDGSGDLFSPGWISTDLRVGETMVVGGCLDGEPSLVPAMCEPLPKTLSLGATLRRSLDLYLVRRDDLKTVIAGYPWFLDWGRDTFIFLRGLLAVGRTEEALAILRAFAAFEEDGTLPNIIYGNTAGNRDTVDAPLWFVQCVREIEPLVSDDISPLRAVCADIVSHYAAGTPNGIRVDAESGLVWTPSHYTWMDTNYPACTPRVGYPIEIQALWISALRYVGETERAERALASVRRLFRWKYGYRDCLAAPNGESASAAVPEDSLRPNQLLLVTLGVLEDPAILRATEELLVPGAIRSLHCESPFYRGSYAGDEDTSRKPAYHNGTAWTWQFPLYAEALAMMKVCSDGVALQLLASSVENLNAGCIGHLSEIVDGDAPHAQKGCAAQAWGDSELLRVWLKLGGK